jgi:hypothetical protein
MCVCIYFISSHLNSVIFMQNLTSPTLPTTPKITAFATLELTHNFLIVTFFCWETLEIANPMAYSLI